MPHRRLAAASLLAASLVATGCDSPRPPVDTPLTHQIIPGEVPTCATCQLSLIEEAVIGSEDGPGALASESPQVRRDGRGRYFMAGFGRPDIRVFGPDGAYIATVGRPGDGPGEHRMIGAIAISAGDTLHVIDVLPPRWSIYSPELHFIRSNPLAFPAIQSLVLMPGGQAVIAVPLTTPDPAARPLQLLDASGNRVRAFGRIDPGLASPMNDWNPVIASSGDSAVWLAHSYRYAMELWSTREASDTPLLTIERDVPWFPPGVVETGSVEDPPPPQLIAMRADDAGRLFVTVRVAGDDWRESVVLRGREKMITDRNGYFDTIVEVIDTKSGELLASLRSPLALGSFSANDMLSAGMSDERGVPHLHMLRLRFSD